LLRQQTGVLQVGKAFVALRGPAPAKGKIVLSLYVGAAILRQPQDSKWRRLLFGFAPFFFACCGVAQEISTTRGTWLHAEEAAV
jgi:hypothetical protein